MSAPIIASVDGARDADGGRHRISVVICLAKGEPDRCSIAIRDDITRKGKTRLGLPGVVGLQTADLDALVEALQTARDLAKAA